MDSVVLNLLRFVLTYLCFAYDLVYLGECSMCIWEECVFCYCWVECSINVRLGWLVVLFRSSLPFLILCSISYWEICGSLYLWVIYLSLQFSASFVLEFSLFRCLHIEGWFVILANWPVYHYIMSLFISR